MGLLQRREHRAGKITKSYYKKLCPRFVAVKIRVFLSRTLGKMKNIGTCLYLLICTPRMQSQQQELQQPSLISTKFPFGGLFKSICTYFKSLNLVCGKWLLKQLLNYFIGVFLQKDYCRYLAQSLGF